MVTIEIYDTGEILETDSSNITYIKTANDSSDITKINSSFSWSIKFPKTPKNTQTLKGLGLVGSGSRIPYEKIYCNVLDNGYPIVLKGILNVKNTNTYYNIYIQDGFIDFLKDIKSNTLSDLDLSELNHIRDRETIVDSFDLSKPYAYLVGDVNGLKKININDTTNLDSRYMSPYANAGYLLDLIFNTYNWSYNINDDVLSSIYDTWISYPSEIVLDTSNTVQVGDMSSQNVDAKYYSNTCYKIPLMNRNLDNNYVLPSTTNNVDYTIQKTGDYNLSFSSSGSSRGVLDLVRFSITKKIKYSTAVLVNGNVVFKSELSDTNINELQLTLNAGDVISLAGCNEDETIVSIEIDEAHLDIFYFDVVTGGDVSFTKAFLNLKISDFIKELMIGEALYPFTDSENKTIKFLTLSERFEQDVVKWENKYIQRIDESYLYNSYSQSNLYKHKYNDDNLDYFDGRLFVDNKNLNIENTLYQSIRHAPDEKLSIFLDNNTEYRVPKTPMFEVDVTKNETTGDLDAEYKFLKDRFYFVKSNILDNSIYIDDVVKNGFPVTSLNGVLYKDILNEKYSDFLNISIEAKVHEIELALSMIDIITLDLSKIYYIPEESSYYFINSLKYQNGNKTKVNLLKINPRTSLNAFSNGFSNGFNI